MERFLAASEPFKRLPVARRKQLARAAREIHYGKGETLFREGQPSDAVWLVRTGRIHLMKYLLDGKISTTCVMAQGEMFCCLSALDRKHYPADAVAAIESSVIRISAKAFQEAMERSPPFAQETLCLFCDRLRQIENKGCMLFESAEQRLAQVLLGLGKKFDNTIPLTRHELAEIAGITHETAIRALRRLGKQGLIRSSRGKVTILSREKLEAMKPCICPE